MAEILRRLFATVVPVVEIRYVDFPSAHLETGTMTLTEPRIARFTESTEQDFGPLSTYRRLLGGDGMPVFTGVQTCASGYRTPLHSHPYVELLFILEGQASVFFEGDTEPAQTLGPGDIVALPAQMPHAFGNAGATTLRLLGIHANPERIVEVREPIPTDVHGDALAPQR